MTPDEASGLIVQPESVDEVPVVEVSHVSKRFGNHQALDDVSVSVYEGEVVAVLGPSGSGKSTLVRCIDQLESIDGGSMRLDGELLGFEERGGHLRPLSDAGANGSSAG